MKVNLKMINSMESENINGKMEKYILETGNKVFNMVKEK
jgi:hypothetical protein